MIINIQVAEKRAKVTGAPVIVCGNADYSVQFTFDEEWSGQATKTARFVYVQDGSVRFTDVLFEGDTAAVPVLANTKEVRVGVLAGSLKTTSSAVIPCEPSIRCGCGEPKDPTPSQYDQILDLLNGGGSNALKGKGEGAALSFPDVSPVEHTLKVRLRRKNLFDGALSPVLYENADFKETAIATGVYQSFKLYLPKGTYTLSFGVNVNLVRIFFDGLDNGNKLNTTSYTFTLHNDGYAGFSFRRNDEAVWVEGTEIQLEEGTEASAYAPYVEDLSSVSLQVCGLNLWDEQVEIGGISSSDGQNADNVANVLRTKNYIKVMPGKLYYVKCPSGLVSTGGLIQIYRYDENKNFLGYGSTGVENGQFNSSGWSYIRFVIRKEYGLTYSHDICLSFDNEATNGTYEPYKGAVYTPKADGRVEGVKSLYPTTTLMTDAEGAVIEAEYNRDLNKAYQALVDAIVALGGSV